MKSDMNIVPMDEFFDEMQSRGLVVVHKSELLNGAAINEVEFRNKQREAMLKEVLPVLEVARLNLLPKCKTVNGLKGTPFLEGDERFKNSRGHTMISRAGIRRLRIEWGLEAI